MAIAMGFRLTTTTWTAALTPCKTHITSQHARLHALTPCRLVSLVFHGLTLRQTILIKQGGKNKERLLCCLWTGLTVCLGLLGGRTQTFLGILRWLRRVDFAVLDPQDFHGDALL